MNKQVNHIISASLFLTICAGFCFFVKELFHVQSRKGYEYGSGTVGISAKNELSAIALQGKTLFMSRCASCHALFKDMTGPGLLGFTEREPWTNRQNVYDWIRNPSAFMKRNEYARNLREAYNGTIMTAFPDLTDREIDAICDYLNEAGASRY